MKQVHWDLLLLEDDPNDLRLFQLALKLCGRFRSTFVAQDGDEAVSFLQRTRGEPLALAPNIIFTDLKMPGMDGFYFLAWLRDHPECAVTPTLVLSGSYIDGDVQRAFDLGANGFFVKPHHHSELLKILNATLDFWSLSLRPPRSLLTCLHRSSAKHAP